MRSRYSAFVTRNAAYLQRTWSTSTRPPIVEFTPHLQWTGLEILSTTDGSPFHTEGTVEFQAHYTLNGHPATHHEHSTFSRENGSWVYVSALPT
jgi:SEC-C motif domain protein